MWLLFHTIGVLLLALVVFAVCRLARLGPAARHALWLVVLLKLLIPPLLTWHLPDHIRAAVAETSTADTTWPQQLREEVKEPHSIVGSERELSDIQVSLTAWQSAQPVEELPPSDDPDSFPWERLRDVAAAVWLCGGIAVAFVQLRRLLRLRAGLTHTLPASPGLASQLEKCAAQLHVRPPRLLVLPGLRSPFVWAWGRSRLLWPEGLEAQLSPQGCRTVLVHELAHLARGDHWTGWLVLLAGCAWWWHPLFYLIRRQLHRQAELACDARVVALLPDARRAYAEALLDVCQRQTEAAAFTPALGVRGRHRDLEGRLVMIMRSNVASRLSGRMLVGIGVLALGLIVLPTVTMGQADKPAKTDKSAPKERDKNLQKMESTLQSFLKELQTERKASSHEAVVELLRSTESVADIVIGSDADKTERDKKLQELEKKVKALLKEVQDLRLSKPANAGATVLYADVDLDGQLDILVTNLNPPKSADVSLIRSSYKLPPAKAEALGKFLQQHVKTAVMETKVEGDTLIVTTTPEVQQGLKQFIALIEGKTAQNPTPLWRNAKPPAK